MVGRHDGTPDVLLKTEITPNEIKYYYQHGDLPLVTSNRTDVRNITRTDFPDDAAIIFINEKREFELMKTVFP